MTDQTTLNRLVTVLIAGIVLLGVYNWWQAVLRTGESLRNADDSRALLLC